MRPPFVIPPLVLLFTFAAALRGENPPLLDGLHAASMRYGPAVCHSVVFTNPPNKNAPRFEDCVERALLVDLPGPAVACYDADHLSLAAYWTTDHHQPADFSKTNHTTYKGNVCLRPNGELLIKYVDAPGWTVNQSRALSHEPPTAFLGYHLRGETVTLKYRVGDRLVLERPHVSPQSPRHLVRSFQVSPGKLGVSLLLGKEAGIAAALFGDLGGGSLTREDGLLRLDLPASEKPFLFSVSLAIRIKEKPAPAPLLDFVAHLSPGPRRWPHVVTSGLTLGKPKNGYALDHFHAPLKNPWGCRMRLTCLDFFPDGSLAVGTINGDVWIVRLPKDDTGEATWSRFASGLYEPLGLKVVDGKVYVRARDRIVRLHDLNEDGEADFYEDFHHHGETGPGYHAFIFDLVTDDEGNFHYTKSGRKAPYKGGVVKLSPDGKRHEYLATDFRHPNGLGYGGPKGWLTVSDNPSGKALYDGFALVRPGGTHGYLKARTAPMLCVLPPAVDSSSASQTWTHPKNWGPLSGSILHLSYSRCNLFYVLVQDVGEYPNSFAVKFPFSAASGTMRSRLHPIDGQVYVAAHKGWDSKAALDGALYRLRHVPDSPAFLLTGAEARKDALRLTFSRPLDPELVEKESFSAAFEDKKTRRPVPVTDAKLVSENVVDVFLPDLPSHTLSARAHKDKKTGLVTYSVNPAFALSIDLEDTDGEPLVETLYCTINSLPE